MVQLKNKHPSGIVGRLKAGGRDGDAWILLVHLFLAGSFAGLPTPTSIAIARGLARGPGFWSHTSLLFLGLLRSTVGAPGQAGAEGGQSFAG